MRRVSLLISAAVMLATPARAAEVLSFQGVGPVQLGMTVKEAERALGKKLAPRDLAFTSDECYVTGRADKVDPGITYVIENGKITVISVFGSDGQTPDVLDKHRTGIGSTEEDIRSAYGQVKKARGFYDRGEPPENDPAKPQGGEDTKTSASEYIPEFWIEADSPDSKRTILFITQAGKITSMTTGLKPMVLEPEPCH